MDQAIDLKFLKYISNDYVIYKNGEAVSGHCYGFRREFRIRKNREARDLYDVAIYKLNGHRKVRGKMMHTMQMMLVEQNNSQIQLRNGNDNFFIRLHNNAVNEIIWKRHQYCTDTIYISAGQRAGANDQYTFKPSFS